MSFLFRGRLFKKRSLIKVAENHYYSSLDPTKIASKRKLVNFKEIIKNWQYIRRYVESYRRF